MTGFRILFWRFADYSIVQKYPKRIITTSDTIKLVEFVCMFKFCSKFISKFRGLPSAWNLLHQIIVFLWITSKDNFWNCRCEKDLLIIFLSGHSGENQEKFLKISIIFTIIYMREVSREKIDFLDVLWKLKENWKVKKIWKLTETLKELTPIYSASQWMD